LDTIELTNPQLRYREPMLLARNTSRGFVDVSAASGKIFQEAWAARGLAIPLERLVGYLHAEASRLIGEPKSARLVAGCRGTVSALRIPRGQPRNRARFGVVKRVG
jgi:hypothetical protein